MSNVHTPGYAPYSSLDDQKRWIRFDSMTPAERAAERAELDQIAIQRDRQWRASLNWNASLNLEAKEGTHDPSA